MTSKTEKSLLKDALAGILKPFSSKFALSWIYDSLFYAVLVLLFTQLLSLLTKQLIELQPLAQQAAASPELAAQAASLMTQLTWTAGISVILLPLLALALYSLFKGLIWQMIVKNKAVKFGWKPFWKFFLLNLIWYVVSVPVFVAWLVLIFYIATLFEISWLAWIVLVLSILLWLHLLITMHYSFAHSQKIGKSLASIFTVGFAKISGFVPIYAIAVVVFLAWSQVWRLVMKISANPKVQLILFGALIVSPFAAWLRIYIAEGLKAIIKR
jgi:hypothetical protein